MKDELLQNVLRLWVACRFIEGRWRCCGWDNLGAEALKNPFRPDDWISPQPYIDYQLGSIIIERIIRPLRDSTLKKLDDLVYDNKPENWFRIFLITFIILHNYELGVMFQVAFSAKRHVKVCFCFLLPLCTSSRCIAIHTHMY